MILVDPPADAVMMMVLPKSFFVPAVVGPAIVRISMPVTVRGFGKSTPSAKSRVTASEVPVPETCSTCVAAPASALMSSVPALGSVIVRAVPSIPASRVTFVMAPPVLPRGPGCPRGRRIPEGSRCWRPRTARSWRPRQPKPPPGMSVPSPPSIVSVKGLAEVVVGVEGDLVITGTAVHREVLIRGVSAVQLIVHRSHR